MKYCLSFMISVHHQISKPYPIRITWQNHISWCCEFNQFHMLIHNRLTSKVMTVISDPIRIQHINGSIDKEVYNKFIVVNKRVITLYLFHKSCRFESTVIPIIIVPKCVLHIFLDSVKTAIMWFKLFTWPTDYHAIIHMYLHKKEMYTKKGNT